MVRMQSRWAQGPEEWCPENDGAYRAELAETYGVKKRVTCWSCKDTGWVQRGSAIVTGALFSRNYKACDACSIGSAQKEGDQ